MTSSRDHASFSSLIQLYDGPLMKLTPPTPPSKMPASDLPFRNANPADRDRTTDSSPTMSLADLAREERGFTFTHFTCEHAWVIGNLLRNALRTADVPALIHISLSSSAGVGAPQTLFHAPSLPGLMPDVEVQVARKRATVLRWGHSTWYMSCRFGASPDGEARLSQEYGLAESEGRSYSVEGGAYPIFVRGVEGVVGVICLAGEGLGGEEAHGRVVQAVVDYKELRQDFKSPGGRERSQGRDKSRSGGRERAVTMGGNLK
jgi:uncharacterized protein (UPF0303 family)